MRLTKITLALLLGTVLIPTAWVAESAKDGAPELTPYRSGVVAYENNNYGKAYPLLRKSAETGNVDAMYLLGKMCSERFCPNNSRKSAELWLEKASEQGNAAAKQLLLQLQDENDHAQILETIPTELLETDVYSNKDLIEKAISAVKAKEYRKAVRYLRVAAKNNSGPAMNYLGTLYYQGLGVHKSTKDAYFWYAEAANRNNIAALYNLGTFYENGISVPRNLPKAIEYYKRAIDEGQYPQAMLRLAQLYSQGHFVKKDSIQAFLLADLAAKSGSAAAAKFASKIFVGLTLPQKEEIWARQQAQLDSKILGNPTQNITINENARPEIIELHQLYNLDSKTAPVKQTSNTADSDTIVTKQSSQTNNTARPAPESASISASSKLVQTLNDYHNTLSILQQNPTKKLYKKAAHLFNALPLSIQDELWLKQMQSDSNPNLEELWDLRLKLRYSKPPLK